MHFHSLALILASTAFLVVRADVDLDSNEIPSACATICKPVHDLTEACDVDDDQVGERVEDLLEAQCVCTNDSFDVAKIAALCASCVDQMAVGENRNDVVEDMADIMKTCGFSSTSYVSAATTAVEGVAVVATRLTASSQLTTTVNGGAAGDSGLGTAPTAAPTRSTPAEASATDGQATDAPEGTNRPTNTPNAAPGVAPAGGFGLMGVYLASLFVLGAVAL